ncbi:MAG TPA: Hpt domain-containing protein, partial [Steroidobacteraceae bacterium]
MNFSGADRSRQLITVGVGTLLLIVMGGVLLIGFRLATQMNANVTALQSASLLQSYPADVLQHLTSLRDRLEARAYAGQSLADLRTTVERFDNDLKALAESGHARSTELDQAMVLWHQYGPVIEPVTRFNEQPYVDSDETGSELSKAGRAHYADVKQAQLFARENAPRLQDLLATVASNLQAKASTDSNRLRTLLSLGVLASLILAAAAGYLQLTRARSEREARDAQEQTRDILRTVKEGFFLLDADYRIGSVWSDALSKMFGRQDFAGLPFEELLKDMVPPATLATATKYIKLLWGDRAHENLMKTINPLGQLEVQIENDKGGKETRYLQFDFHRVMGPKGVKHVLCSVTDITSSVLLARELQESQEQASQQVDMMLGVMHIDPVQLMSFLDTSEASLQLVNAILKEPARTDAEFRKKLDGLFRELHSIKGEASALNLMSVAQRVHALEDIVTDLKKRPELSGNDFLPMILKLDDLLAHLRAIRELATRLSVLRSGEGNTGATMRTPALNMSGGAPAGADDLSQTLQSLAERLAADHQKKFNLVLNGLADVPAAYKATVKDVLIQMLRNAAVHGIEPVAVRRGASKDDVGQVRVDFRKTPDGFEL